MSRSIDISYRDATSGAQMNIEVSPPYFLLGTQRPSMQFWSNPRLKEIGIERLSILGVADPVYFEGWDGLALLRRELELLTKHLASIEFSVAAKAEWLSHLVYCYHLLVETAPKDSIPLFSIG